MFFEAMAKTSLGPSGSDQGSIPESQEWWKKIRTQSFQSCTSWKARVFELAKSFLYLLSTPAMLVLGGCAKLQVVELDVEARTAVKCSPRRLHQQSDQGYLRVCKDQVTSCLSYIAEMGRDECADGQPSRCRVGDRNSTELAGTKGNKKCSRCMKL